MQNRGQHFAPYRMSVTKRSISTVGQIQTAPYHEQFAVMEAPLAEGGEKYIAFSRC